LRRRKSFAEGGDAGRGWGWNVIESSVMRAPSADRINLAGAATREVGGEEGLGTSSYEQVGQ